MPNWTVCTPCDTRARRRAAQGRRAHGLLQLTVPVRSALCGARSLPFELATPATGPGSQGSGGPVGGGVHRSTRSSLENRKLGRREGELGELGKRGGKFLPTGSCMCFVLALRCALRSALCALRSALCALRSALCQPVSGAFWKAVVTLFRKRVGRQTPFTL
jgi:hypothetical protein